MIKLLILGLGSSLMVMAADGEAIFKQKGCTSCHRPDMDTVGPSLKKIAQAYAGKREDLIKFLKGQGEAIVDPAKASVMKMQLARIKDLSDEEFGALADYILKFK